MTNKMSKKELTVEEAINLASEIDLIVSDKVLKLVKSICKQHKQLQATIEALDVVNKANDRLANEKSVLEFELNLKSDKISALENTLLDLKNSLQILELKYVNLQQDVK